MSIGPLLEALKYPTYAGFRGIPNGSGKGNFEEFSVGEIFHLEKVALHLLHLKDHAYPQVRASYWPCCRLSSSSLPSAFACAVSTIYLNPGFACQNLG